MPKSQSTNIRTSLCKREYIPPLIILKPWGLMTCLKAAQNLVNLLTVDVATQSLAKPICPVPEESARRLKNGSPQRDATSIHCMDSKASLIATNVVAEGIPCAVLRIASEVIASMRRIPPSLPLFSKDSCAGVEMPTKTMMRDKQTTDRAVRVSC